MILTCPSVTLDLAPVALPAVNNSLTELTRPFVPCTCGIFLTGQFTPGAQIPPSSIPALSFEFDYNLPCSKFGNHQCANNCLQTIAKQLPKSETIICGAIGRDCFKERAYLWTKNCNNVWVNSKMSAGREYCCKDGAPYKCPLKKQ
ncbi:hypothetical protein J6590_036387 [Homalodisca vitripennis]|nr:hypothetical protein J6590_036387 [Homalodisca vitripennis]